MIYVNNGNYGVRSSRLGSLVDGIWRTLSLIALTALIVIFGTAMRGDGLLAVIHMAKQLGFFHSNHNKNIKTDNTLASTTDGHIVQGHGYIGQGHAFLSYFNNVHWYILLSVFISFSSFFSFVGWLQWYFYIKRKDQAKEWKCQPDRWLTKENERHEMLLGTFNMGLGGTLSGIISCYILNGGYSTVYYNVADYGWLYLCLSTVLHFLVAEGILYGCHRMFHHPLLYKVIHKVHHRYVSPTAFSATAMHPVEFITYQTVMASPMFLVPVHAVSFVGVILYTYYYGVIAHSGIKMDAIWPWQPESMFHDDHHRYFHANFGFNIKLYDWLFDTIRLESRSYDEDAFGGKGKSKSK